MPDDLLSTYLNVSWRMGVVIGAWLLLRKVFRRRIPAGFLALGWVVIIATLLLPWRWPTGLSPFNWLPSASPAFTVSHRANDASAPDSVVSPRDVPARIASAAPVGTTPAIEAGGTVSAVPRPRRLPVDRMTGLTLIWLTGFIAFAGIRLSRWIHALRVVSGPARPVTDDLGDLVTACARELSISVPVRIGETSAVDTPSIWGLRRPTLLFPASFDRQMTRSELRLVILHELGHWCRRDLWMHELSQFARALHWFNPLVWIAARSFRDDCEAACDEFVMRRLSSREIHAYGAALLKVLGMARGQNRSPVGLGLFDHKQKLKIRIQMIAHYQRPGAWRTLAGAAAVAALVTVSLSRELHAQSAPPPPASSAGAITTMAPAGWFRNGQNAENYTVGVDGSQPHILPSSAYVRSNGPGTTRDFGGMMQMFDAAHYHGKRVRFSAWMKTLDADEGAQLWMRIDGTTAGQSLQFDNMGYRPHPRGTTEWMRYEVVLDVAPEATAIALGFFIKQSGQAWVNDAKLEVVDQSVPVTDMKQMPVPASRKLPPGPANLEFNGST
jgi:bla regulator protein BlaR1